MKLTCFAACVLLASTPLLAQEKVIPIWPGVAPGSEGWTQKETTSPMFGGMMVRNVTRPNLTLYSPPAATANGTAVIVCPGGGFQFLSWENEGVEVAKWLNARSVTALVLKYRLANTGETEEEFHKAVQGMIGGLTQHRAEVLGKLEKAAEVASDDGRQAVKVVREHAADWGIAPDRIGIMGFSAGARVTLGVAFVHDGESRPSFAAPIYGPAPLPGATVPADAGPMFIVAASDDPLLPATDSSRIYDAWKNAGHSAELHIFAKGGHGFGMRKQNQPVDHWIDLFGDWLDARGLLKKAQTGSLP